jgi:micrococcal nuclease
MIVNSYMLRVKIRCLVMLSLLCFGGISQAKVLTGVVTYVGDGDTLWVRLSSGGEPVKVRFQGMDAPEICQDWGPQATRALKARAVRKEVVLNTRARDDYGRILARVDMDGEDLGAWMVAQGHAWSYHYRRDPGPYATQERSARSEKRGLWAANAPTEPREFRKQHGSCLPKKPNK